MAHEWHHMWYKSGFDKHVATLTPSQRAFPHLLHAWIQSPKHKLVIVAGGPGTGKTYTVIETLKFVKIPQLRMAPTARVAHKMDGLTLYSALRLAWGKDSVLGHLQKELELEGETDACIAKSQHLMKEFDCKYRSQIVVLDEVGMMAHWLTHWIIRYFFQQTKPILFIVMGDPNQLRPVKSNYNIFNVTLRYEYERIDLLESKRFTQTYERIIEQLRGFVDTQDTEGMFTCLHQHFPIVQDVDCSVLKSCTRAMAYLKSTVDAYNTFYLRKMLPGPVLRLWKEKDGECQETFVDVKAGCHVFVTQNGVSSVPNGTYLKFEMYDSTKDVLECSDPNHQGQRIHVKRNANGEFPIIVGFAATVHKFQGDTMDDEAIAINFNESTDLNLIYTALSRVKGMAQVKAIQL